MGAPAIKSQLDSEMPGLVERAKNGDESAFSSLIELNQRSLFRFCLHLSGNAQHAEDICQDTFIKALEQIGNLKDSTSFLSWLFRIARNRYLDAVRSPNSKSEVIEEEENVTVSTRGAQDDNLGIRQALLKLTEEERAVLILVDLEEYSYLEASEIIGVSENALRSRVHRARQAFLKIFGRKE